MACDAFRKLWVSVKDHDAFGSVLLFNQRNGPNGTYEVKYELCLMHTSLIKVTVISSLTDTEGKKHNPNIIFYQLSPWSGSAVFKTTESRAGFNGNIAVKALLNVQKPVI